MARDDRYYTTLHFELNNEADKGIATNLLCEFYEGLENDDDFDADRKFASMSDNKEIIAGFNAFYNLTPKDDEYLD